MQKTGAVITIVIADSLIRDFASPDPEFASLRVNVGAQEIHRTMGEGAQYGRGPLPTFLRAAHAAARQGHPVHLVLVRDRHDPDDPLQQAELTRYGAHAIEGTDGAEFVDCLTDLMAGAHLIDTPTLAIPTPRLHEVLKRILGRDPFSLDPHQLDEVTFVICGFHTDKRVLSTAFRLRNEYGFRNVLVCPHLVGSSNPSAHAMALQVALPDALVGVVPSLPELGVLCGVDMPPGVGGEACRLDPPALVAQLKPAQRSIVELLFLFDDSVALTPLKGGFSGSLLFVASAARGGQRQVPVVVKVGPRDEVHREISGYHRVKDLLGLHVPTMHPPVSMADQSGMRMTLAAMEGHPVTLQRMLGEAVDEASLGEFLAIFDKTLTLLRERLYENTRRRRKLSPYHELKLSGPQHLVWLRQNLARILPDQDLEAPALLVGNDVSISNPLHTCPLLLAHVDYLSTDVALCHGDLNLANVLSDDTRAVWVIDWPWCEELPIELDLAKLENDLKHVVAQDFGPEDLPRFVALERLLAEAVVPPASPPLDFVRDDFRFRKMYESVRRVRLACHALKTDAHVELLHVALLRFALHTLSFDARNNKGECELAQLQHALISVATLAERLQRSPLHSAGPRDRHPAYPPRAAVPPELRSWEVPYPEYAPATAPSLTPPPDGDDDDPRAVAGLATRSSALGALRFDGRGRPLNPSGRTGLGGRGFFFRWGPNRAVDAVITRVNPGLRTLEFALVKREDTGQWGIPGVLVHDGESENEAFARVVREKLGLALEGPRLVERVLVDDFRNTDHAWVESALFHLHLAHDAGELKHSLQRVTDAEWLAVTSDLAPHLFASHARLLGRCVNDIASRGELPLRQDKLQALLGLL